MRGSSGAVITQAGDLVTKQCDSASLQVDWLMKAKGIGFVDGIESVGVHSASDTAYTMTNIVGHCATLEPTTAAVRRLYEQVRAWRNVPPTNEADWDGYIARLRSHADFSNSSILHCAVQRISQEEAFSRSFCHGDLTLENVIIGFDGVAYLIDPNYAPSLYQSWLLDAGKLLQSTHTQYHEVFDSNAGCDLRLHDVLLQSVMMQDGVYRSALLACLSHIIRLAKYHPTQIDKVEYLASKLVKDIECLS